MPQYPPRSLVQPRIWRSISSPDYEVRSQESGLGFSNEGADGQVNFFLPPAYPGRNYAVFNAEGQPINVVATGGDHISVDQTVATSFNDGGAAGSFLQLECPAAPGLWVATGATKAWTGGGGGGLPNASGSFTAAASPIIPLIAGYRYFMLSFHATSNAPQSDGQGPNFRTSPNLNGSAPDTAQNYLPTFGSSSASSTNTSFFWAHWSGTAGGADPLEFLLTVDAGAADEQFKAFGAGHGVNNSDQQNLGNMIWIKTNAGLVQSLVIVPDNPQPGVTFTGKWFLQALNEPPS